MSIKKTIEIEAIAKDAIQQIQALNAKVENLEDALSKAGKETKKTNKILGGLSSLMKTGLGIGVVTKLFDILKETFMANQKVADIFSTGMEALSLVFNQVVNAVVKGNGEFNALGTVLTSVLNIGLAPFKLAFEGISIAIMSAQKAFLEFTGGSKERIAELQIGIIEAKASIVDIGTGVIDSGKAIVENFGAAVDGIKEISFTAAYEQAQQNIQLQKTANLAIAQNRIVLEQKDREAEKLRQIRDDESKTIDERIEANNKLAEVLNEQERLMLANADAVIAAAQAQFDKNGNDENQIALLEARAEREGILAQIEGFRSEQLTNINSLERERLDIIEEGKEKEIEAAELKKQLKDEENKKEIEAAELKAKLKEEERQGIKDNLDAVINAAGQESSIGKALFIAKQAMLVKEQIAEAKATLAKITMKAADASVATATGAAQTAKVGFPQNIPLLIAFAAQAAGIFSSIKSAVGAAKSSTSKFSGGGGGVSAPSAPAPPAFNIVGASETSQLSQTIGEKEQQPVKAFVVSNDVTTAQSLDRNIVEGASLG